MRKLILVLFLLTAGVQNASAAGAFLDVGLNRAELVSLGQPMNEVMIANPEIADVVVHGAQKVSVIGKKIGSTNLRFFDTKANLVKELDIVVGYDLPAIRRTLKKFFPNQNIGVETINNSLAVSGIVPDAQMANRIMEIVYEFVKESRKDDASGGGSGERFKDSDNRFPGIVNLLTLNSGQQVMLKVRIGEVRRDALKQLGFSLQEAFNKGAGAFEFATGGGQRLFNTDVGGVVGQFDANGKSSASGIGTLSRGNFKLGAMVEALEKDGLFKILAEPNLTTVSGEAANFLAGGEFPITSVNRDGGVDVQFKQFGISLAFTPYVLSNDRIRLTVAPEMSELSDVTVGGANGFPSLNTRKAKTTVELAPGESFMIAGLIRDRINSDIQETPGIAELPIISALFRSSAYQREETELVIAVTPYIVDPVVSSDIRLPTDDFRTPSVLEMQFYGALGALSGNHEVGERPVLEGPIGFMMD